MMLLTIFLVKILIYLNNFDWRFLRNYLGNELRDASPVNMLQSSPFLYSGREWIDRYYGEDQQYNESFQNVFRYGG
jgi:hypothetical protein